MICWYVALSRIAEATCSTICGSDSSTSMDRGSGFCPSSVSMMSDVVEERNFSSACSFVVKPTEATPSSPWMKLSTVWMSASEASSDTYAVMDTSSSTDETSFSTTKPPTRNTPMMSSDRKMVTMDPNAVDRLRVKPLTDSFMK